MSRFSSTKRVKNADTPEVTQRYYLTNSKLLPEVHRAKGLNKVTNELATMLMMLTRKYAQRPCFSGYTYKEDMISEALANLCQNALKFNPEISQNPFAWYTTCIHNSFLQFLNIEKKHRKIRDQMLIDIGENPSYNFTNEYNSHRKEGGEFSNELTDLKNQIEDAKVRTAQEAADKIALDLANAKAAAELAAAASFTPETIIEAIDEVVPSLLEFDETQPA